MKKSILVFAFAAICIFTGKAQTPVVNYSFEQSLASTGSGAPLVHNGGNPSFSTNTNTGNGSHALSLGGSEYFSAPFSTPSGLTGYTVNYWVKLGSKPGYNVGVCQLKYEKETGQPDFYLGSFLTGTDASQKPYFEVYTSTSSADYFAANDTLDNNWHMLTFKWEPDTISIFIDGVFNNGRLGPSAFISSNSSLHVGALENNINGTLGYQSSFAGLIDEIRIYETGLSNESILSLYNTGTITSVVNNTAAEIKVGMYPNPANTMLNIRTSEHIVKAEVLNAIGVLLHEETGAVESVNVSQMQQGVYFLKLTTENGKQTVKKFIKE